jgi:hypothetical protein
VSDHAHPKPLEPPRLDETITIKYSEEISMTTGSFWSGETLAKRLPDLIEPYSPNRIDCAAYTLAVGPEAYVSPNDQTADPTTVTFRKLADDEAFTIPRANWPSH